MNSQGVSFAQSGAKGKNIPEWKKKIKCHNYGEMGHFMRECPKNVQKNSINVNYEEIVLLEKVLWKQI